MPIAVRELKSTLSRVLARAQAGETIEVTCHNKPIARITGIAPRVEEGLEGLIADGALCWNGAKPKLELPLSLSSQGTPVSQMVLEDRR